MKFKVDVECTPEEARTFLGLPDLTPLHDHYIQVVMDTMSGQGGIEQLERMFKGLSPFGDAGMKLFASLMDIGMGAAAGAGAMPKKKDD